MQLKETLHKSKSLAGKAIQNLKSFFFGGYNKLPESFSFSCGSRHLKSCKTDQIYTDLYEEWEAQLDEISRRESKPVVVAEPMKEEGSTETSPRKTKQVEMPNEKAKKKKTGGSSHGKGKARSAKEAGLVLAQKMKELEMVDSGDMEQALDIEEAIHYYSRLKSPVYLDIVDKFFVDMYSEISVPPPVSKIGNSKRRLGSFRM